MVPISFRKVSSIESLKKVIEFLKDDVKRHGGTASETHDIHGHLWDTTVSCSKWGPIVIRKEVTRLEALVSLFNASEEI